MTLQHFYFLQTDVTSRLYLKLLENNYHGKINFWFQNESADDAEMPLPGNEIQILVVVTGKARLSLADSLKDGRRQFVVTECLINFIQYQSDTDKTSDTMVQHTGEL